LQRMPTSNKRGSFARIVEFRSKESPTFRIAWAGLLCLSLFPCVFLVDPHETPRGPDEQALSRISSNDASPTRRDFVGDSACQSCHENTFKTFEDTRHHQTSQPASEASIAGKFVAGANRMKTVNPQLTFRMDTKNGHFYQTAVLAKPGHNTVRTEQFDIVIGSGRKGQTYLYWRGDGLYELPVSYWTDLKRWVNSPGYVDGSADFDRSVTPRCVECHATYFQAAGSSPGDNVFRKDNFVLGISCERCHGPGSTHIQQRGNTQPSNMGVNPNAAKTMPPVGLGREAQIDVCAQCHGGVGEQRAPAFSFTAGQRLADYITLHRPAPGERVDVHGNQVALLQRSRCYQSSAAMTCTTCHDPHVPEQPTASYSGRCTTCHQPQNCGIFTKMGSQIVTACVDCHMPIQTSRALVFDDQDHRIGARVLNHWIRVYPDKPTLPISQ
jgi:Cytochrome c554 and c-prime